MITTRCAIQLKALCCQRQRKHGEAEKLYMEVLRTAAASHSSSVAIQNDTNEQNEVS